MRNFSAFVSGFLLAVALVATKLLAQEQQPTDSPQTPEAPVLRKPLDRFDGTIKVRTSDGQMKELHVVVRNWIVDSGKKIPRFPEEGFMIVQLRSGEVATTIDGQRQERKEGEFWTVPVSSSMSVETGKEAAVLQTMVIRSQ